MPLLSSLVDPNRAIQLASDDDWFASQGAPGTMAPPRDQRAGSPIGGMMASTASAATDAGGVPSRPGTLEEAVAQANQLAYGGANKHNDVEYWRKMWNEDPGYTWQRLLGWQAGGADAPQAGPYAGQAAAGGAGFGPAGGAFGLGVDLPAGTLPANLAQQAAQGLENSPGFQFRLGEGLKALEKSAAARGTLLTGGTAKGLERYAQDFASNEYANQYNRLFGEAQERYRQAAGITGLGLQAQGQRAGQLSGLAQLGLNAAGQQAGSGSQYAGLAGTLLSGQAGNIGNAITGQGNAQSAGTIASGNAWQQGLGGLSNLAQQYYLLSLMNGGGGARPDQQAYWNAGNVGPVRT